MSFLLALCCLISGSVHTPAGAPIAHARLVLHGPATVRTSTDSSGHFSTQAATGTYQVQASGNGFAGVSVGPISVNRDVELDIVLEPLDSPKLRTIGSVTVNGRLARVNGTIPAIDLTRADLDRDGQNRVADALLQVPSLDVQYPHNAGSAGLATISLRGPDPSETMLTLDGQLLNDANTGDVDISQLPVAPFSSVSVTEGLGPQDLEGSSTIGGAVNLVSLRPTRDPHTAFSLSAGSFGRSEAWYNTTGSLKKLGYAFALDDQQEGGYVNETDTVCPIGGGTPCAPQHLGSADSQRTVLANLEYSFSQNADIGARIFSMGDSRDQSASITGYQDSAGGTLAGPGPQTFAQTIRAYDLHGRAPLGAGSLVADVAFSNDNVDLAGGGISNDLYDLSHQDKRATESLQWQRTLERSEFAIGGYLRQEAFIAPGTVPRLDQSIASYFVRAGWQPNNKLHLNASLYESNYTTFGSNLDGRFGAIYNTDPSTSIRFSVGTGFRAPLLIERYVFPLDQLPPPDNNCVQVGQGNPNEKPEHATEYELGASHQFGDRATIDASLYRTILRDPIENFYPVNTFNPGCATTYTSYPINVGNVVYQGAEVRYAQTFSQRHVFLSAMYGLNVAYPFNLPTTVSNPTSGATLVNGQQFANIPQQQASLELDWANRGWHAGTSAVFRGKNNPLNQGPLVFVDAAIGKQIGQHVDFTIAGTNLFNAAAGKFQVFNGGVPYRGLLPGGGFGNIPTNLLNVEPAGARFILTFKN